MVLEKPFGAGLESSEVPNHVCAIGDSRAKSCTERKFSGIEMPWEEMLCKLRWFPL